jgi:MHS family proline/betaine transporter-like MFS transporter
MLEKQKNDEIFFRKFTAMAIGNLMEWFDFSCFGALIDILGTNFFPSDQNRSLLLLNALTVFGAAFVMRPLGGIIMGWIGDTFGRKRALEISILLMLFPSFLIGCLPLYNDIGVFATILLVFLRLLQGLAAGGELVGAFLYTLEATDGKTKGFWGGACKASGNLGTSIGIGLVTLLRYVLTKEQLYSWGWRIPFWLGLLFGCIGVYARTKLKDEAGKEGIEFQEAKAKKASSSSSSSTSADYHSRLSSPIQQVFQQYWKEILIVIFVAAFWGCSYYSCFIWLVYYLSDGDLIGGNDENGIKNAWIMNLISNIFLVIMLPLGGWFGDFLGSRLNGNHKKGTNESLKFAIYLMFIVVIPCFLLFITRIPVYVAFGQLILTIPVAIFGANLPAFMTDCFPVSLRFTGVGIGNCLFDLVLFSFLFCVGYNCASAIFSSTASIIQTSLVLSCFPWQHDNYDLSFHPSPYLLDDSRLRPAYYLIFIGCLSLLSLTFGESLCKKNVGTSPEELSLIVTKPITVGDGENSPIASTAAIDSEKGFPI